MIASLIKDSVLDQISADVEDIYHDLKFVNISGNKWQAQINFDLDESSMSDEQKLIIAQLLKYL
jgi:hypothetical protein